MTGLQTRAERITQAVRAAYPEAEIALIDDSQRHAGHAGAAPGGETHYRLTVISEAFAGQDRVARSRRINALLAPEFDTGLHALNLVLRTPAEQEAQSTRA